ASFTVDHEFIYFIAKVRVPRDATWRAYRARLVWHSPDGSEFRVREDLERGYIWSLRDRLPVRGSPAAGLPGTWRIVLSISFGPSRSTTFTLAGRSTSAAGDDLPADSAPVEGREREPNNTVATANLLTHGSPVQGELRYFSAAVYDQDWFVVRLAEGRRAWLEVNAVGSTSGWVTPRAFLHLSLGEGLDTMPVIRLQSRRERRGAVHLRHGRAAGRARGVLRQAVCAGVWVRHCLPHPAGRHRPPPLTAASPPLDGGGSGRGSQPSPLPRREGARGRVMEKSGWVLTSSPSPRPCPAEGRGSGAVGELFGPPHPGRLLPGERVC
ncbi:MAG: hypothetical protein ACP5G2_07010, partial [Candidatus Bipolaricaulaceae bacterium]